MLPHYNSFPHLSNQLQTSTQPQPPQQQVMASQSQLGLNNSQIPTPFSNSSIPNVPTSMPTQPGFMNGPNNLYPLPNNHLGMPHFSNLNGTVPQPGKTHVGFGPQSNVSNVNSSSTIPIRGQGFGHGTLSNLPQFNQNVGLSPFGQICLPNHLQNMNQFLPMQMQNLSQFVPQNAFGVLNQALQATVHQNPSFLANPQFGNMHYNQIVQQGNQNQHNLPLPGMDLSTLKPSPGVTQQLQGNPSTIFQTEQTNNSQSGFMGTQRNCTSNGKSPSSKNFTRNAKRGMPQGGFQNSQFHHMKHGNKKFAFSNAHKGRGPSNEKAGKFGIGNPPNQVRGPKRSLSLAYTEEEILKWREERRKNYPSKGNVEKKLAVKQLDREVFERDAGIRRQQLKEILSKQAELGVEVAEIPGCYLTDPKQQGQGREENGRPLNKKGRVHNKFDKRGRHDKKERYSKKQRLNDNASSNVPVLSKRKPTLLEKLLSADIKRDKCQLLQAFRFMVMNSFFKDGPDKPLKFPAVIVKEGSVDDVMVEEMFLHAEKDVSEISDKTVVGKTNNNDDIEDDNNGNDTHNNVDGGGEDDGEEEEGEIIN